MEKLETIEEVDKIFFWLKNEQKYFTANDLENKCILGKIALKKEKIAVILDYLNDEGLVDKSLASMNPDNYRYRVNVCGLLFDGYQNKKDKEAISNRNKCIQTFLLVGGTIAAGVYGIFEIMRWLFHHEGWRLFF